MDDHGFVRQPFSASFLVVGVVGFFVSLYAVIYSFLDLTWGLLFMLMFAIFALAALKSIKTFSTLKTIPVKKVIRNIAKKKMGKAVKKVVKKKPAKKRKKN
ncbi:hypothetical protein J4418_03405 [Candidatus Woesearchaeota archaeon]|nr:hypothetical protein [Candidatus Woesearchaeota archaeon]